MVLSGTCHLTVLAYLVDFKAYCLLGTNNALRRIEVRIEVRLEAKLEIWLESKLEVSQESQSEVVQAGISEAWANMSSTDE